MPTNWFAELSKRPQLGCGWLLASRTGEEFVNRSSAEPCWNVAPTMCRPVMHVEGGALLLDDLHLGLPGDMGRGQGAGGG